MPRWQPLLLLGLALLGVVAVTISIAVDEGARDWPGGRLGGSTLYLLDAGFALLLPFIAAGAIALALFQHKHSARAASTAGGFVRRHDWTTVLTHWLNALGLGVGMLTGAWLLRWFGSPFSLEVTYILHFIGAALSIGAVLHHLTYNLVEGRTGLLPRSWRDLKNALAELVGYAGVYRGLRGAFGVQLPILLRRPIGRALRRTRIVPDPEGKFLALERVLSYPIWTLLIGLVIVTGTVKALHYVYALPADILRGSTFLHDGAAIFLVIFLAMHVASLVLVPRNWPLLASMFTSRIGRRYVDEELPRWAEQLDADRENSTVETSEIGEDRTGT